MRLDAEALLDPIRRMHREIMSSVMAVCEGTSLEETSAIDRDEEGDTIYRIDTASEDTVVEFLEREVAAAGGAVLIAEGIEGGRLVLPRNQSEDSVAWKIIVDPIDGTRGLMYQKRSAWILTGIARNLGPTTSLQDIEVAVQTEIPLVKQHLADQLWAVRGRGANADRINRLTGETEALRLTPSKADSIAHGFATISRFFPGAKSELASIEEEIVQQALGPIVQGKALCFEDQYISTGGQLYELIAGHDRFIADLRPLMERFLAKRGQALGICCHPYDLCTELIARECGIIVTDAFGQALGAKLAVEPDVAWVGYANPAIRDRIEPLLQQVLKQRGYWDLN
ncbi:MAG TPA: inositol monophosphatase [Blastocatellia bacterium]|nr:inositol monophosphatase [Blastocatellia bacterium]